MGDCAENITEIKAENRNCSSLVYQVSQLIVECKDDLLNLYWPLAILFIFKLVIWPLEYYYSLLFF